MSEERDDVLVLIDDEGNEIALEFITSIDMDEKEYVVLVPVNEDQDSEEAENTEEVVILRVEESEEAEGEEILVDIEDEAELNKVFAEFKSRVDEEYDFEE